MNIKKAPSASTGCRNAPWTWAGRPRRLPSSMRIRDAQAAVPLHAPVFQRLVAEVSLGQVGMVLMLEASRLARNGSRWHQLIELCGLSHTGLSDEGTVYD